MEIEEPEESWVCFVISVRINRAFYPNYGSFAFEVKMMKEKGEG